MSFWGELKRRNVYKVGVAYAIVAWLLIQAAAIIFPHLNLPSWAVTLVIVILIIGFPLALLLAWAYEVTPDGIKRTKEVPLAESITHLTGQKLNYIVTGLLVVAVAVLVIDNYIIDRKLAQPELPSVETAPAPEGIKEKETPKTIAVIPFVNLSPDPDQEYFVDGLSEELLNCLSKIAGLRVTSRTSSFLFKDSDKSIQEIASVLGVEHILEGSVRKAGDALRISAQLIRAKDDYHLWSETYNRELKDIFTVQEDIATAVADELKVTLGIEGARKIFGGTDNEKAHELYLIAKGQYNLPGFDRTNSMESVDAAIALDPEFALAWALKAAIHNQITFSLSGNRLAVESDACLQAAQKAIELEPNLAEAHAVLGGYRVFRGDWVQAESAYRKALELGTESSLTVGDYNTYLTAVGYLEKANKFLKAARLNDPLNVGINTMYMMSFSYLGDRKRAEEECERGISLFGDQFGGDAWMTEIRRDFNDVISLTEMLEASTRFITILNDESKKRIKSPEELLEELRRIYTDAHNNLTYPGLGTISNWAAYLGDPELAMDGIERTVSLNATSISIIWRPLMREVRQLPRFKEFVQKIGLVDYWNKFGWPDMCHQLDNGDFECD